MNSSPLSSPPASSVVGGNDNQRDGDNDLNNVPRIASAELNDESEIDLVLVSSENSPPQRVLEEPLVQAEEPVSEELDPSLAQEPSADLAAELAQPRPQQESQSEELSQPEASPQPGPENVAATQDTSSPRYTNNAFALILSSSPNEGPTKEGEVVTDEKLEMSRKEGQRDKEKEEEKNEKNEKYDQKEGEDEMAVKEEKTAEPTRAKTRSRPQRRSKTPADATSEANGGVSSPTEAPVTAEPVAGEPAPAESPVTTTRSGRRVVPNRQVDTQPSPVKALKRTPAKARMQNTAAKDTKDNKSTPRKEPSPSAAVLRRRKQAAARWQTDFVLSNTRSPLTHFDLRTLLCQPEAWSALSADEQKEVLLLFPPTTTILDAGTDNARPDVASLKNDNNFRHDCARYRSDLEAGFLNKNWLEEAFEAHAMRQKGLFDGYVLEAFESTWGVSVPAEYRPRVGEETTSRKRSREASVKEDDKGEEPVEEMSKEEMNKTTTAETPTQTIEEETRSPKRQKQDAKAAGQGTGEEEVSVSNEDTAKSQESVKDEITVSVPMINI
ncbi:hypothetical protein SBRCBS47491_007229 [Sporothrix bragantina]|uniref:DEUBAD domain-containing protein n=1 Tax=Sporothrix bragantina TaxID=671064 RepID=A0ABP0CE30_9PEZI